ncbi:DUF6155 family protein [Cohnella fermenti]|uniref:Uncharacterized protein n=1 Tax=Cohnella fermenti TaxID=2565925 RepID=A0A4S4BGM5_9BACL|nr:DUF6155 family protein [Cohnella fermenti]THF73604.1 hypothetical protein E6C55_28385 [Cohnella fermenti]
MKLNKVTLKRHLKQMNQEQLAELVVECFGIHKDVERFVSVKLLGQEAAEALFPEYRKKVVDQFFPERGYGKLKLKEAKKAIHDFNKLTGDSKRALELKFVYVENGIEFTRAYGDIDERFYNSVESVFSDIVREINDSDSEELFKQYEERIHNILERSAGTGWGFNESLYDAYSELSWV